MTKKKVHKLSFNYENDYKLIGIASHENDYRLSWAINKALGISLIKEDDLSLLHPKHKVELNYAKFAYTDELNYLNYYLISNKSDKGFLLPEIKNIDFILKVSGDPEMDLLNNIITNLKKVDIIITAFVIEELPDRLNKIFTF